MAFQTKAARAGNTNGDTHDSAGSDVLCVVSSVPDECFAVNGDGNSNGEGAPPACLTGVIGQADSAIGQVGRRNAPGATVPVLVDWFRVTLPDDGQTWQELAERFGDLMPRQRGLGKHYERSCTFGDGGLIGHCASEEQRERMGLMLELSGSACATLGDELGDVMRWAMVRGRCRRIDLALDCHDGTITFDKLTACLAGNGLVTRARTYEVVPTRLTENGQCVGWKVTVGKRTSDAYLRIYDKGLQLAELGEPVDGPFVRTELECKGDLAHPIAEAFLERGGIVAAEQLRRRYQFKTPSPDITRRKNWPDAPWYLELLGNAEKGGNIVAGEPMDTSISRMKEVAENQFACMLASIELATGDDFMPWLVGLLDSGRERLKPHHIAAVLAAHECRQAPGSDEVVG